MLLALLVVLQAAPVATAPAREPAYVSGFCAYVAMSEAEPAQIRRLYAEVGARTEPDSISAAFKPEDAAVVGQMVSFGTPGSPKAFVERRRGSCTLVYPSARVPTAFAADIAGGVQLSAQRIVPWKKVNAKKVGPPGPIRYFLPASDDARYGVCAAVFEDLRLHDATPATLVRVETCRLAADDSFD